MSDASEIRVALGALERAEHHRPGQAVKLADVYTATSHRSALDPERGLVVGNRGMGKSFWVHALRNPEIRAFAAKEFRFPALATADVVVGFNGSDRLDGIAPTAGMVAEADAGGHEVALWQAVLARAVAPYCGMALPPSYADLVRWVQADAERIARLLTQADDVLQQQGKRLLLLFDALDLLSSDWQTCRRRVSGLLQLVLKAYSFRAIRTKVFLRLDQFHDQPVFRFSDGSKVRTAAVHLRWSDEDLYRLLFYRLRGCPAFVRLQTETQDGRPDWIARLVRFLSGTYMGSGPTRGFVETWLPTHLADAADQISPRTFLTAWREAARHGPCPSKTAVDHHGILEGVRKASEDRLAEIEQDYPWVPVALSPLRGESVPLPQEDLLQIWRREQTVPRAIATATERGRPILIEKDADQSTPEAALLNALGFIGVVEVRRTGKVDI
ncbi:MAG TPA: hypothetical protein PKI03_35885, partial [Pseudomonadota bacterium]|nr:hypothetical protein [Pseudomonadota bacterium]